MAKLFKDGYFQPNDKVGRSLAGAQLFFYTAGTTSPKNTYTSKDLSSTNAHPVVADAAGRFPPIWLDGTYDVDLKDSNNVLIDTLEDVGATDETINTTASLQFKTLADLKALEAQNGLTVDPDIGDALHTTGKTTTTDDEGADWVVVDAGTGTPDDDLYVDLANGLQAERVFNNLYRKNNGSDIENTATFRTNIDVYDKSSVYTKTEVDNDFLKINDLPTQLGNATLIWNKTPTTAVNMDTDIDGGNPGDGFYLVVPDGSTVHSLIYIESGVSFHYGSVKLASGGGSVTFLDQARKDSGNNIEYVQIEIPAHTVTLQNIGEIYKVG